MSLRLTKKRQEILDVLKKQPGTLSAAQISKQLPSIDLVTIYRNLDLFVTEKLIKQIYLGTDEARYEYQNTPHHHAICTDCKKVIHFTAPDNKITKLLGLGDFNIEGIEVTVRGICNHSKR